MSRCSVDGQVSLPFPYVMNGVFATSTTCTDGIVAKIRRRVAIIIILLLLKLQLLL